MKDLFGYQNQGVKYDIYRPSYPQDMVHKAMSFIKGRESYLDIATGTGKILFQLSGNFKHSTGLDLSKTMISVCEEKVKDGKIESIVLKCGNFMEAEFEQKFDLITIGQALHWFPIKQFLTKTKTILNPGGILAVYGYILDGIEGQNEQDTQFLSALFHEFYDKRVKINHDFDVNELHTHYSDKSRYPFEELFSNVVRQVIKVPIVMDKNGLISYVKTFSGYNTYLERYPGERDPIIPMQEQIPEDMKITCIFYYFSIICSQ